jgi:hypothetical protein
MAMDYPLIKQDIVNNKFQLEQRLNEIAVVEEEKKQIKKRLDALK